MAPYREQLAGTVDLETLMSSGLFDLPAALGSFHTRYPLVSIRPHQNVWGAAGHLAAVSGGSLDLALVAATRAPARIALRLIAREDLVLLCTRGHRLADRRETCIADLEGETVVQFAAE